MRVGQGLRILRRRGGAYSAFAFKIVPKNLSGKGTDHVFQDTHRIYEILKRLIERIFGESTHGEGDTFYINGAASLPPPLEPGEEAEAIEALPDAAARSTLIEHNLRLVAHVVKKISGNR